jgi:hypothetical protein
MWKRIVGAAAVAGGIAYAQPPVQHEMVPLGAMNIAVNDTANVPLGAGTLRTVRIQAMHGGAYIDFVELRFMGGATDRVPFGRRLSRDESADVDLNGKRELQAVTVTGEPDDGARIQVIGLR